MDELVKWRLLELEANDAFTNMAIDEALTMTVGSGRSPPTIRFYQWKPAGISLGYYQDASDVLLEADCVRRITGGAAVFHDSADLTYSVVIPEAMSSREISETYKGICSWMLSALSLLNIQASLEGNDIRVSGRKISGNAQARVHNAVLQHGTLIYSFDVEKTARLLKVEREKLMNEVTSIREHQQISFSELYERVKESFVEGKDWEVDDLSDEEQILIKELLKSKYLRKEWNLESPGKNRGPCYVKA
ncbi:MAG TPA: biotin/lipoate A/B protein ligase family protein [Candidatus Nanoarchaeia archaeon]|nr:biotin/lipoate A/B protein ligase family protein [Candidatus Nanoarchaeia archaeon]